MVPDAEVKEQQVNPTGLLNLLITAQQIQL